MNIYKHDVLNCGISQISNNNVMDFICFRRSIRFEIKILRSALKKFGDYKIINLSFLKNNNDKEDTIVLHTNLPAFLFENEVIKRELLMSRLKTSQ